MGVAMYILLWFTALLVTDGGISVQNKWPSFLSKKLSPKKKIPSVSQDACAPDKEPTWALNIVLSLNELQKKYFWKGAFTVLQVLVQQIIGGNPPKFKWVANSFFLL